MQFVLISKLSIYFELQKQAVKIFTIYIDSGENSFSICRERV